MATNATPDALEIAEALHTAEAAAVGTPAAAPLKVLHDKLYRGARLYGKVLGFTRGDVTTMSGGGDKDDDNPDDPPK